MTGRGAERLFPNDVTENGTYSYGRQQSRIFANGRKPDRATPRAGRRASVCKLLLAGMKSCLTFVRHAQKYAELTQTVAEIFCVILRDVCESLRVTRSSEARLTVPVE